MLRTTSCDAEQYSTIEYKNAPSKYNTRNLFLNTVRKLESVLTQSSDGVMALPCIKHLPKHVGNANPVAEHVSTDLDSTFRWSSPPDVNGVGLRSYME